MVGVCRMYSFYRMHLRISHQIRHLEGVLEMMGDSNKGGVPLRGPGIGPKPNIVEITKKQHSHAKKDELIRSLQKDNDKLQTDLKNLNETRINELRGFADKISELKEELRKLKGS